MLMIANKAYHPTLGYNYEESPLYRSLSSPSVVRRHSFSSFENATYKRPASIDTTSTFSKPSLDKTTANSLTAKAKALGYHNCDLMITYEFTKEAFKALSLPSPQTPPSLASEKVSTHAHFEWQIHPCKILRTNLGKIIITESHAINICDPANEEKYYQKLQNEESIVNKTNSLNEAIGLTQEKITRLGMKKFYLCKLDEKPKGFYRFHGLSHKTEAHLEDCYHTTFSSKEEFLKAAGYLIHQVDIFHRTGVYHMDIKPHNICKTKDGKFKVIDRYGSLDFTKKETLKRLKIGQFNRTSWMISESLHLKLTNAPTIETAKEIAKIADIFATGSTLYQMTFAFLHYNSIKECGTEASLPYSIKKNEHPCMPHPPEKLHQTLHVLTPNQQNLIKKTLSINNQPSLKELKAAFPLPTKET